MTGLINIGAGLAAAGDSISKFANESALAAQKNMLEQDSIRLSNQLAQQREHAGRVETGAIYEGEGKRLSLIPSWVSIDSWLKQSGYGNGLKDLGMDLKDFTNPDGSDKPTAPAAAPARVKTGDVTPAPGEEETPTTAPTNDAITAEKVVGGGSDTKPPVLIGPKGKPIGLALPPGWTQGMSAIAGPEAVSKAWAEWGKPEIAREGGSIVYYDFAKGKPQVLYHQPHLPVGAFQDADGNVATLKGATDAIEAAERAKAAGEGYGGLKPKEMFASFEAGVKAANTPIQIYDDSKQQMVTTSVAAVLKGANQTLGLPAPKFLTDPNAPNPPTGAQRDASVKLRDGITTIPPPPMDTGSGSGNAAAPSAADAATQKTYEKMVDDWVQSVPAAAQAEQRMTVIADSLRSLQSGAWANVKAEVGRHMIAAGFSKKVVDDVMNGSPASAQIVLKNNFMTALEVLSNSKLGRITQNEIFAMREALANPNLEPEANYAIVTQGIGVARWQQAFAGGWDVARKMGYDPLSYQTAFVRSNPVQQYVDQAKGEVKPFKGMQLEGNDSRSTYAPMSAEAIQDLRAGKGTRESFDKHFGPGMADSILGPEKK